MRSRFFSALVAAALFGIMLVVAACTRDFADLGPAQFPTDAGVFDDGFSPGVDFGAFGGSKLDALSVDLSTKHSGTNSFHVTVPAPGDPTGGYAGGAWFSGAGRDLSGYNALTFWAKSSIPATLNTAGFGNDNAGNLRFLTEVVGGLPLTTAWKKYVIPIPDPKKLTRERGLFEFAEGPENGAGYDIWFDEAKFEKLSTITNPRPLIPTGTSQAVVGQTVRITGGTATYSVNGVDETVTVAPDYFTYLTSNPTVATVGADGTILVVGAGNATITARLGNVDAAGSLALTAIPLPTTAAPAPTQPASDVISLFSNAYPNVTVDKWSADWDHADVTDIQIAGDDVKLYTNIGYAGIEFISQQINATLMTTLHLDVYVLDATAFKIKLIDFGGNGVFGGGDDTEQQLTFTSPTITANAWNSLDIPLSAFTGLTSRNHLAQMVIEGSSPVVYLDNLYLWGRIVPPSPSDTAASPTAPAGNVISLFSNVYTNVPVDTWLTPWSAAQSALVDPYLIAGHAVKKYSLANYAGIEFVGTAGAHLIDASSMTSFHMDVWSPEAQHMIVKIHDAGADGVVGTGDDSEGLFAIGTNTVPGLTGTGQWISLDIPFSAFTVSVGSVWNRSHLAQIVLVEDTPTSGGTVYVDHVYFTNASSTGSAPTNNAPTPTVPAASVISLFSTAYTNQGVDTWQTSWSAGNSQLVDPFAISGGHPVKKYSLSNFVGVEFGIATPANTVDATAMTHFHVDVWSPNPSTNLEVQLVNDPAGAAAIGKYQAGQFATGSWVSLDIPLASFTGLSAKNKVQQLLFVGAGPMDLFIDNVYFYNSAGGGPGGSHVFFDGYDPGVSFADFGGATNAVSVDAATTNNGRASFKAIITGSGGYSGGAFVASAPRDLSTFNALTFWAKASTAISSLKVGIGNNTLNTRFNAEAIGIPLTTTFQKFIIPLPDPSKLTSYDGLFHFADGPNNYTVWFNDVQYESLPAGQVGAPTGATTGWSAQTVALGSPFQISPAPNTVSYTTPALPNGGKLTDVAWRWFTLTSSNPAAATVDVDGLVTGVAAGTTNISATMNGIAVAGNAPITVTAPLGVPTNNAPTPSVPAANVISLFSTAYTNQGVDTWQTGWSAGNSQLVDPFAISGGHAVKQYTLTNFVGIEFGFAAPANTVDATTMTHFHVDVWSPNPSSNLEIQLVDFSSGTAVGHYQAGQFTSGGWVSLDIPLSSFTGLTARSQLRQLLFVGAGPTVLYIDNVYFHN